MKKLIIIILFCFSVNASAQFKSNAEAKRAMDIYIINGKKYYKGIEVHADFNLPGKGHYLLLLDTIKSKRTGKKDSINRIWVNLHSKEKK